MVYRLFTLLAAACLLLLLPEIALWIRSYWVYDSIQHDRSIAPDGFGQNNHYFELCSIHGSVSVQDTLRYHNGRTGGHSGGVPTNDLRFVWDHGKPSIPAYTADLAHVPKYDGHPSTEGEYHALGITVLYRDQRDLREANSWWDFRYHFRTVFVEVPWLAVVLPTSLLPALWIYRWWKRRRLIAGVKLPCGECGYSLVGNVTGVCPECGTAIVAGRESCRIVPAFAFPAFAVVSLLFCLSAVVLFARSYWNADVIHVSNGPTSGYFGERGLTISSGRGALIIEGNSTDPKSYFLGGEHPVAIGFQCDRLSVEPSAAYPSLNYEARAKALPVNGTPKWKQWKVSGFELGYLETNLPASGAKMSAAGAVIPMSAIALIAAMPTTFWIHRRKPRKLRT